MATAAWLKKNRQVICYLPEDVYEQFEQFRIQKGFKSSAKALTTLVEEYFNKECQQDCQEIGEEKPQAVQALEQRVEVSEQRIKALEDELSQLLQAINTLNILNSSTLSTPVLEDSSRSKQTVSNEAISLVNDHLLSAQKSEVDQKVCRQALYEKFGLTLKSDSVLPTLKKQQDIEVAKQQNVPPPDTSSSATKPKLEGHADSIKHLPESKNT